MASTDARPVPIKNTAFRVTFPILDNTGALVASAAGLDSEISKDGGTFTDCTNEATQIATTSGMYYLDLTSTEMNADTVAIIVKTSTTDAKTTTLVMYPQESGDVKVDLQSIAGSAVSTSTAQLGVNVVQAGATAWGSGAITAGSIASSAITSAKIASGAITSTGIAASAIGATQIATDAITAAKIAADAIGASELAADAVAEIQSGLATTTNVSAVETKVDTLLTRITSTLFSGITSLAQWLGLIAGKQTGNSTARTELRATGAGSGTFDETTDSQEALRDRGDSAWITATGFSTLDAAGVRSAIGLASANLDTQIAGLPTDADVNAQVDIALGDYNGPTYTELLNLFRVALRSDAATATDLASVLTAINADLASGAGDYSNTTEALEAIRDRGDAAWITATGFSTLDATGIRSAVGLASANLDTQFSNIPTDVLDDANGIETSVTPRQALRAALAAFAGQATGGGTTTIVYKNPAGDTTRVTLTVDSSGNRSASVLNL